MLPAASYLPIDLSIYQARSGEAEAEAEAELDFANGWMNDG